jgi:hypothetical protein
LDIADEPFDKDAGHRPARATVYEPASEQDKGLDNRKSVKTPSTAGGVENPGAIIRPGFPPAPPAFRPATETPTFPRRFSTAVERVCG